jgi:predicted RND superfamily exporter protein
VRWLQWVVLPIYLLITAVAIAPGIVGATGLTLTPLQVEAVVLSLLLFFGVQTAWFLLLEPTREERRKHAAAHDAETAKAPAEGV